MLKLKHVALYEGVLDLLIGPRDEELVVIGRLHSHIPWSTSYN